MKKRKKILHINFMILFILIPINSYGQTYASIGISVNILPKIEVIGERPLNFGVLSPGDKITIDLESEMSGCFSIYSDKPGEVFIDFQLPTYLHDGNGNKLPINFKNNDAGFFEKNKSNLIKRFNPNHSKRIEINRENKIYIGCDLEIPEDITHFGQYYGEIIVVVEH